MILSIDSPAFHESFSFDDFAKVAQADCRSLTHQISPHVPPRVWQQKGNLEISVWDHAHNVGTSKMLSRHACEARTNQRPFFLAKANARFTVQIGRRPHRLSRCNGSRVYVPAVSHCVPLCELAAGLGLASLASRVNRELSASFPTQPC